MLTIQDCPNVSKKEMKEALTKMQKLEHLDVYLNKWFDNEIVQSFQSCKQLAYFNIEFTLVSCEGIMHLKGLTHLNILICGNTKINRKNLIELTKQTTTITRLCIKFLWLNDYELLQISANCQALTHLNIISTNIKVETLLKIKQLKVVVSDLRGYQLKKLREAGIQINQ